MRIVVENRERNSRPKLKEVLDVYRNRLKHATNKEDLKAQFREKLERLYQDNHVDKDDDKKDEKYQALMDMSTRIKQQLGSHQLALSTLVMRVNNLAERKKRRENARESEYLLSYNNTQHRGDMKISQLEEVPMNRSHIFEDVSVIEEHQIKLKQKE